MFVENKIDILFGTSCEMILQWKRFRTCHLHRLINHDDGDRSDDSRDEGKALACIHNLLRMEDSKDYMDNLLRTWDNTVLLSNLEQHLLCHQSYPRSFLQSFLRNVRLLHQGLTFDEKT